MTTLGLFKGEHALVTGSAYNIGRLIAQAVDAGAADAARLVVVTLLGVAKPRELAAFAAAFAGAQLAVTAIAGAVAQISVRVAMLARICLAGVGAGASLVRLLRDAPRG